MPINVDGITIKYHLLPDQFRFGAEHWIEHGTKPGGFLSAVIENDLLSALGMADDHMTRDDIRAIALWFHWQAPSDCHGSHEKIAAWRKFHRRSEQAGCLC